MFKKRCVLAAIVATLSWFCGTVDAKSRNVITPTSSGNLSKEQVDIIIDRFAGKPFDSFQDFSFGLYNAGQAFLTRDQLSSLANFAVREELSGRQREVMFRVLGLYSQFKYGGDALRSLKKLIEIPLVKHAQTNDELNGRKQSARPLKQAPALVATAKLLRKMATEFGLKFNVLDENLFEISMPGRHKNATVIGLHTHLAVSNAQQQSWVVDGAKLNPFTLTKMQGNLYGRGVQDNKNAIVITMYAMRVMFEEKISLLNNVTLMIDTSGHARNAGFSNYVKTHKAPAYNMLLDGKYPVDSSQSLIKQGVADSADAGLTNTNTEYRSRWGRALIRVASESLNASVAVPSQGQSLLYAQAPRTLQFGLSLPNESGADPIGVEYKTVDQFLLDLQIVTEVIARIGQMRVLD